MTRFCLLMSVALALPVVSVSAEESPAVTVKNRSELMKALQEAKPGTRVLMAPGK